MYRILSYYEKYIHCINTNYTFAQLILNWGDGRFPFPCPAGLFQWGTEAIRTLLSSSMIFFGFEPRTCRLHALCFNSHRCSLISKAYSLHILANILSLLHYFTKYSITCNSLGHMHACAEMSLASKHELSKCVVINLSRDGVNVPVMCHTWRHYIKW